MFGSLSLGDSCENNSPEVFHLISSSFKFSFYRMSTFQTRRAVARTEKHVQLCRDFSFLHRHLFQATWQCPNSTANTVAYSNEKALLSRLSQCLCNSHNSTIYFIPLGCGSSYFSPFYCSILFGKYFTIVAGEAYCFYHSVIAPFECNIFICSQNKHNDGIMNLRML